MRSSTFLFILNANVGLLTKTFQKSGLICRMCQIFLKTSDVFGSILLYVKTSGMYFLLLIFSLFCKTAFHSIKSTFSICLFKLSLHFLSKSFSFITAVLWYSSSVKDIAFNLNVWLFSTYCHAIFSFTSMF